MPDVLLDFPIRAPIERAFDAVSTPAGLDQWWSLRASGRPGPEAAYALSFGPGYDWEARVTQYDPPRRFELELTGADADWLGTRIGFALRAGKDATAVRFHHVNWAAVTDHYRVSCFCWAMYLRILRRHLEYGESVPYERRLDA